MGQTKSKENNTLSKSTYFSKEEIDDLRQNVRAEDQDHITEQEFKDSVKQCMPSVSMTDDVFLKRLYHAFGGDENRSLDFSSFVDGLSVFMKGTPKEKLKLSFKLYDVDKDGYISRDELENVILELSKMSVDQEDNTQDAKELSSSIDRLFEDFDVDGDDKLSFSEYKLSFMKEPLIADFLEKFLDLHGLQRDKKPVILRKKKSDSSDHSNTNRSSFRLSQAELLDYSYQQNQQKLSADASPRSSLYLPLTPVMPLNDSSSSDPSPHLANSSLSNSRSSLKNRTSRGTSVASIDAAIIQMSS